MRLTSPAFIHGSPIPSKYGRDFENVNPPLRIEDVPPGVVSLALVMEDPDVPPQAGVPVWDHWVVFNIPPAVTEIPEGWRPEDVRAGQPAGVRGHGTRGELDYGGPRPPDRPHRYFFRVYALDAILSLAEGASKQDVLRMMDGHVLASAELMGTFAPAP